mgnify:CR=1 FL=1
MERIIKLYNLWCKLPDKLRFLLVGGYNAAFSYIIYIIAVKLLGEGHYQICVALQWSISSIFSFINQKIFVFCTKGNWIKEYLKCCTTWVVSYFLNAIILELIVKYVSKNVYIDQLVSIFIVSIVTYVLFKYFAFKHHN